MVRLEIESVLIICNRHKIIKISQNVDLIHGLLEASHDVYHEGHRTSNRTTLTSGMQAKTYEGNFSARSWRVL